MGRRWFLAVTAWLVTAALTTAVAIGAVNSLRAGIFGPADAPLSESDVRAQLPDASVAPSPSPSAVPTGAASTGAASTVMASTGTAPAVVTKAFTTGGGAITASCAGGLATLTSWIPASGFEADHVQRGPAPVATLRFKARSHGAAFRLQVTCVDGSPLLAPGTDE